MGHHPLGHHRPDPLDQPGAQVAADPLDRRRQHRRVGVHLELLAVFGMAAPAPGQPQAFADLGAQQRPDDRQQIRPGPLGRDPSDRVAGLLVGVGDPLQDRLQHRLARAAHAAGTTPARSRAAQASVELQLAHAAVRERELLAQPGDLLALALALIQRGAQPGAQRRVAGALADRHARRRGSLRARAAPRSVSAARRAGRETRG